jgi:hypothetical protein
MGIFEKKNKIPASPSLESHTKPLLSMSNEFLYMKADPLWSSIISIKKLDCPMLDLRAKRHQSVRGKYCFQRIPSISSPTPNQLALISYELSVMGGDSAVKEGQWTNALM